MLEKNYIILLYEKGGIYLANKLGYWDGEIYWVDGQNFPGVIEEKFDEKVKRYKTKIGAEKAAKKLEKELVYISKAEIETILINNE